MSSSCEQLASEIAALRAEIARIPRVDVNDIVEKAKIALIPLVGGIVIQNINPLSQKIGSFEGTMKQMNNSIQGAVSTAGLASREASGAKASANVAVDNLASVRADFVASQREQMRIASEARLATVTANQAKYQAATQAIGGSAGTNVPDKTIRDIEQATANAARKTELLDKQLKEFQNASRLRNLDADMVASVANQANLRAGQALNQSTSNAAKVAKVTADTANEVSALRGAINGIGSQVNKLGNVIASVESKVGTALTNAAKAIGISEQALGATAKLGGQVLQIFNVIGTIFSILDGVATRESLGGRIDAMESAIIAVGASVSTILGKLLGLQNRLGGVEGQLPIIKNIANDALATGQNAAAIANDANTLAGRANSTAQLAINKANQAQLTADGAVRNASIANDNATTAFNKAGIAQSTADSAITKASTASLAAAKADNRAGDAFSKAVEVGGLALTTLAIVQGIRSIRGLQGIPGLPGRNGVNGVNGVNGRDGVTTVVQVPVPGIQGQPGTPGRNGINGINGRDAINVNPAEAASLRALIIQQHTQTRLNSTAQHSTTRVSILSPILAAFAPVTALLKSIYDIVSKAAGAAQVALLTVINNKLGQQVTGGITGFMRQIGENSYIDKVLGYLTFAATVHNGLMLSNNLGVTLMAIIDSAAGLIMPKGVEGAPIVISEVINKTTQTLIIGVVGQENYTQLSEQWALANRIYQATANVVNQVVSLGGLLTSGMEIIGGNVGKIGNALRKGGVLLEDAYQWMNPQPNMKGKFFTFANNANETLNTVQAVVAVPVGIKESLAGISSSNAELKREIAQIDPTDEFGQPLKDKEGKIIRYKDGIVQPEPTVIKAKDEQTKADSTNFLDAVLEDIFDGEDS